MRGCLENDRLSGLSDWKKLLWKRVVKMLTLR